LQLISIGLLILDSLLTWQPQPQQLPSSAAIADPGATALLEQRDDGVQLSNIFDNHEVANEFLQRGE
jgi:hypothetical protein